MTFLGCALLFFGVIACLYGQVRFLVVAWNRNLWWFFGCLFVPLVDLIFLFRNFKATIRPFALTLLGLIVAVLGAGMAGIAWPAGL